VALFDSSFEHQHFITLSIRRAEKHTDGANDFIFGKEEYIEVWMSETQFARAITSMNIGSGTPCTLARFNNKSVPQPKSEDCLEAHDEMVEKKLNKALAAQEELAEKIRTWRQNKHRPTLTELDDMADTMQWQADNFAANMGYYAACFEKHAERIVDEAKTELEVHALQTAGRLGLNQNEMDSNVIENSQRALLIEARGE
jgi:hypothetical protein